MSKGLNTGGVQRPNWSGAPPHATLQCDDCGQHWELEEMHNCNACSQPICPTCWPDNAGGLCEGCADVNSENIPLREADPEAELG